MPQVARRAAAERRADRESWCPCGSPADGAMGLRSWAAPSSATSFVTRVVAHDPFFALNVRRATGIPSGRVLLTRRVRTSFATAIRVDVPSRASMLPEVSRSRATPTSRPSGGRRRHPVRTQRGRDPIDAGCSSWSWPPRTWSSRRGAVATWSCARTPGRCPIGWRRTDSGRPRSSPSPASAASSGRDGRGTPVWMVKMTRGTVASVSQSAVFSS